MNPNLIKEINQIIHDIEAVEYDAKHVEILEGDRAWWQALGSTHLTNLIRHTNARISLLDIGCGTGFVGDILSAYLRKGDTYAAYDYSLNMLNQSLHKFKKHTAVHAVFINGDAEKLPFHDSQFDVITVNAVLHHLPEYAACLREVDRVVRKGGLVIVAHEQNRKFFKSWFFAALATIYKLIGGGMHISDAVKNKVNTALKKKKLISTDLSKEEIMKLVDFHSPIEQYRIFIDRKKGFDPSAMLSSYFAGYEILELSEYSTFFHRGFVKKNRMLYSILKIFNTMVLLNKGP
ncbi:MAG: class I SAM-dependent methyltransferase, partial [bacterium]